MPPENIHSELKSTCSKVFYVNSLLNFRRSRKGLDKKPFEHLCVQTITENFRNLNEKDALIILLHALG